MQKCFRLVAVGGTFDSLHKGHEAILEEAFRLGERVVIGLTSDSFAKRIRHQPVDTFEERKRNLEGFLRGRGWLGNAEFVRLDDPLGPAASDERLEAIVVSKETLGGAREINERRRAKGLRALEVVCVETVLAEDGLPITSTRVREGIIDRWGKLIAREGGR